MLNLLSEARPPTVPAADARCRLIALTTVGGNDHVIHFAQVDNDPAVLGASHSAMALWPTLPRKQFKLVVIEIHVCETEIFDRQSALRSTSHVCWRWQGRSTTSWQAARTGLPR
jgi:hypothetical protein